MSNNAIFITQIASILGFIGLAFGLYRLLVATKDATIEMLKEKATSLQTDLEKARAMEPDVLAARLGSRIDQLTRELERLSEDKDATVSEIGEKEAQLDSMRSQLSELRDLVDRAQEVMGDFLCPHCGAAMATREYHCVSYEEGDIDGELTTYECGLVLADGRQTSPCSLSHGQPSKD